MAKSERPLSPHLQVYRPMYTTVLSIAHRATGIALGVGTLILAWWLIALASGPDAYRAMTTVVGSLPGRVVLLGFTWALFYHLCNGIRHLWWDTGRGYGLDEVTRSGQAAAVASVVLTLIVLIAA